MDASHTANVCGCLKTFALCTQVFTKGGCVSSEFRAKQKNMFEPRRMESGGDIQGPAARSVVFSVGEVMLLDANSLKASSIGTPCHNFVIVHWLPFGEPEKSELWYRCNNAKRFFSVLTCFKFLVAYELQARVRCCYICGEIYDNQLYISANLAQLQEIMKTFTIVHIWCSGMDAQK